MPASSRRASAWNVLIAGALVVLLAMGAYVLAVRHLDGFGGGELIVERAAGTEAFPLDEERTRREMPRLADMLDRARVEGRVVLPDREEGQEVIDWLQRLESEASPRPTVRQPAYLWRGEPFLVYLQVD